MNFVDPISGFRRLFYLVTPFESFYKEVDQVPNYVDEAIPYFIILMVLEAAIIGFDNYRVGDAIASVSAGLISLMMKGLVISVEISGYIWVWEHCRIAELSFDSTWTWLVMFFGLDLGYYWFHRFSHEVNIIWGAHQVHHSSEHYNLSTALRQSAFQPWFSWVFYLPLALFIRPSVFLVHSHLNLLYQFWIHTEVVRSVGPLEWVLNTPSHHRVHHARNREAIDRNYAGVLIIWDRMFGTFEPERPSSQWSYGLTHPIRTLDPFEIQLCHFKYIFSNIWSQNNLCEMLKFLFYGPGWGPGKPRLGLLDDIPDVNGPRRVEFDPHTTESPGLVLSLYGIVQFIVALITFSLLQTNVKEWHAFVIAAGSMFVLSTFTTIGWLFEGRPRAKIYEAGRCALVCVISQLLANFANPAPFPHWTRLMNGLAVTHLMAALLLLKSHSRNINEEHIKAK